MNAARASRRDFLRSSALAASAVVLGHSRAAWPQAAGLETVRLSGTVVAVLGPGSNSVAAQSGAGVILVDGGSASWSADLLASVDAAFPSQPIGTLINTHWHPEQTGANVALGERGAQIIAHENTKLWLSTEVWVRWSGEKYPPLPPAGIPTNTLLESERLDLGGRTVDCRYLLNAHTDGDLCVFLPEDNVLATGGAVSNDGWPIIDWWTGGWLGGMLDAYDALLQVANDETRIVPSKGPVMSLADLRSQHEMYLAIFDRLQSMLRKSYGTDEVLAAKPAAEFEAQWGDSAQFLTLAFHSMWGHLRDAYDTRLRTIP